MQSNKKSNYIVVFLETIFSRFTSHFSLRPKAAFTEPSRGMSKAKGEQESTETLSFRCDCERCRLTRGAVAIFKPKAAFTLAEVLITLGIIGVVAAMTMPVLINNVQARVKAKRIENIKQKLSKATDKMAVQSGMTDYGDTLAFVTELNKHMKLAKICDNAHIAECWPVPEVNLKDKGKTWEISKTQNAKTLKIPKDSQPNYADTVGIITADGTSLILSYDKKCSFDVNNTGLKFDEGSALSNSMSCLAGVFDWNGSSKPNKLGEDILTIGLAAGLGNDCAIELGGKCFTAAFTPTPLTFAECEAQKSALGIKECHPTGLYGDLDYWAGAVKQCGGVSKMPTYAQLKELSRQMYVGGQYDFNSPVSKALGLPSYYFDIWVGKERDSAAWGIRFYPTETFAYFVSRSYPNNLAVCLGE